MHPRERGIFRSIWSNLFSLPFEVQKAFVVQLFSWFAWFAVFVYGAVWLATEVAGGDAIESKEKYEAGVRQANSALAIQQMVAFVYSVQFTISGFHFPGLMSLFVSRSGGFKWPWAFAQIIQGGALLLTPVAVSTGSIPLAQFILAILGITWASTLSLPWAVTGIAVEDHPERGVIMAIMNLSQVLPQFALSIIGWVILDNFPGATTSTVLFVAGASGLAGAGVAVFLRVGDFLHSTSRFEQKCIF
eukprot:GABV01008779.1.p1 GENE.GABV01008779.1~~GABV01008779.1.p1  ORF type:complete len:246 (-),score=36.34 GABV01008779.1:86-823(-)